MTDFKTQMARFMNDPDEFIADHMANRHMWETHEATSQARMLNNVLKPGRVGGKFGDSQFRRAQNTDLGTACVKKCLEYNLHNIYRYAQLYQDNGMKTTMTGGQVESRLFHTEIMANHTDGTRIPDYIGFGFRMAGRVAREKKQQGEIAGVEAVKTNSVACIIRATDTHPDGWEITSAFPMVTPRETELTESTSIQRVEKNFENQLHNTFTYQSADPVSKAYMDVMCSGKPLDPKYRVIHSPKTDRRPPMVTITRDNMGGTVDVRYPTVLLYANQNPPANATLLLGPNEKLSLGSQESIERLRSVEPGIAGIYESITEAMPDEFRPVAKPRPLFRNRTPSPSPTASPPTAPRTVTPARDAGVRYDPGFDSIAAEIERGAKPGTSPQIQME